MTEDAVSGRTLTKKFEQKKSEMWIQDDSGIGVYVD